MIIDELIFQIHRRMPFRPTSDQFEAMRVFAEFMLSRTEKKVMVLCGSAGTGKSTLAGAFVRALKTIGHRTVLMAPTGRAAKVFTQLSGSTALTIHRKIYRQKDLISGFTLAFNGNSHTLFIVDEGSMVANMGLSDMSFGSGRLLDDLLMYVFNGRNCHLLIIGDRAQLPPVGERESPALSPQMLSEYGLSVFSADLNEVVRQETESGILYNATHIRGMLRDTTISEWPCIRFSGFPDVECVDGQELIETIAGSYSHVGIDETIVITRSNKRANIYNEGIRRTVLGREEELSSGDLLMIARNNYYWTEAAGKQTAGEGQAGQSPTVPMEFVANGDIACLERVRNIRELYGFKFADVLLRFPDFDDYELSCTIVMDSLMSESPSLTREQSDRLFHSVWNDYEETASKAARMRLLRQDRHYNAMQVKYAYAVTCHKAQGGQWAHVYIDQGYMTAEMLTPDYIHWLYTAVTRATEKVFFVNWPSNQREE